MDLIITGPCSRRHCPANCPRRRPDGPAGGGHRGSLRLPGKAPHGALRTEQIHRFSPAAASRRPERPDPNGSASASGGTRGPSRRVTGSQAAPGEICADRRFGADRSSPLGGSLRVQILQFCLVRLSAGRSPRISSMSGLSLGVVAGLARGPSAVVGEPPAGNRTHPAGWGHAG